MSEDEPLASLIATTNFVKLTVKNTNFLNSHYRKYVYNLCIIMKLS